MSKWEKLISQILALSNDLRFDEVRKVLESYGYIMASPRGGSSHCTFRKPGNPPVTIPKHGVVKRVYVQIVKEIIEREGINDENS